MKKKILLLCCFSNEAVRSKLHFRKSLIESTLRKILNRPSIQSRDLSAWVSSYIDTFEKHNEYEYYVLSFHTGMNYREESFALNGINYLFFNRDQNFLHKTYNFLFNIQNGGDTKYMRKRMRKAIENIKPDLILLAGAENADYSEVVLNVNYPIAVIPQTLLNSPKRIELGLGTEYRRMVEKQIFEKAKYFLCSGKECVDYIYKTNKDSVCLKFIFPTAGVEFNEPHFKLYDFVFFAGVLNNGKGIMDTIKAFGIVNQKHPETTLDIIGSTPVEYKSILQNEVNELGLSGKVVFTQPFQTRKELFTHVLKSKIAVLPGITAALNSTVRESMLLGLPTIVYNNDVIEKINAERSCVFSAEMQNINDLADKMCYCLDNHDIVEITSKNGKRYADTHFSASGSSESLITDIDAVMANIYYNKPIDSSIVIERQ